MADQKERLREADTGEAAERKVETTYTGTADPNRAADIMKDRDSAAIGGTNTGGFSASEGADTDGAGTGGMVERKDAGGEGGSAA